MGGKRGGVCDDKMDEVLDYFSKKIFSAFFLSMPFIQARPSFFFSFRALFFYIWKIYFKVGKTNERKGSIAEPFLCTLLRPPRLYFVERVAKNEGIVTAFLG